MHPSLSVAGASLLSFLMLGCGDSPPPVSRTAVRLATVTSANTPEGQRYSADLRPVTSVDLAFRVGGYVQSVTQVPDVDGKKRLLQAGDRVSKGQELAALRSTDFAQQLSKAQAALAEARANAVLAQQTLGRTEQLAATGSVSAAQLDAARSQRNAAQGVLQGAQARVEEARTAVADARLRSPMDGVVLERKLEVGTLAEPGRPAFTIADTSRVNVVFGVPDTVVQSVRLGAAQPVLLQALPGEEFAGRISRIAPSADPKGRLFEIEVELPNSDGRLKPGMVASLVLQAREGQAAADQPLIPMAAVVRSPRAKGAFSIVLVEEGGEGKGAVARLRDVELGEFMGTSIPVVKGLKARERIVVTGASLLAEGEPVQVLP